MKLLPRRASMCRASATITKTIPVAITSAPSASTNKRSHST